jgi:hypothetical protein
MTNDTLLYRQVHPQFMTDDLPTSQAFKPFPGDVGKLSVYDGDLITAEGSYTHWTGTLGNRSAGVWGVSVAEVAAKGMSAASDPLDNNSAHALIDFEPHTSGNALRRKAKELLEAAIARGCLHAGTEQAPDPS